jgi:hypothetical protein
MTNHHKARDFDPRANRWACNCEQLRERDRERIERAKQPYTYEKLVLGKMTTNPTINTSDADLNLQVDRIKQHLNGAVAKDILELFHFNAKFYFLS